jgi:HEAT repeat protein
MARVVLRERGYETLNYPITQGKISIGRANDNTIMLKNRYASGHHCEILYDGTDCILVDLKSTNGVFVNGARIESKKLEDGDKILAGAALLIFVDNEEALEYDNLVEQLQSGETDARELAASLLGQFGTHDAVDPLLKALTKDPEPKVKAAAAEALGFLGDSNLVDILLGHFDTDEPIIRNAVIRSILRLADDDSVDGIAVYLKHMDRRIRVLAAYTLGQLKSKRAAEHLINALDDDAYSVREAVVKSLGDIKEPSAAKPLIQAATEPNRFPLMWVIDSLGKIRNPTAVPLIMKALKAYESEVREVSAEALGKLLAPESVPSLLEALADENPKIRKAAAISLEKIRRDFERKQRLRRSTDHDKPTMAITEVEGLGGEDKSVTPMYGEDRGEWEKWWSATSDQLE